MSKWFDVSKENIDIDGDEVNILVTSDNDGNVWVTIKLKDIKSLIREHTKQHKGVKGTLTQ